MAESRTKGFGERLRRGREEAGRDIQGLADVTRVQARYIQALENEDWAVVPRGVIGRGFVRVLARELALPAPELLELYQVARGDADSEPQRSLPEVDWKVDLGNGPKRVPLVVGVGVAVVLVAVLAVWWWWHRPLPVDKAPVVAAQPPSEVVPAKPVAPVPTAPLPKVPPSVPPAVSPVPEPQAASSRGALRLELEARDRVWVKVTEDGGAGRERVLKPGEKVAYHARTGFQVKLGNGGAVKLYWNGTALKPAGRSSQVVTLTLPQDLPSLQP